MKRERNSIIEGVGFGCGVAGLFCLGFVLSGLVLGLAFGLILAAAGLILAANA